MVFSAVAAKGRAQHFLLLFAIAVWAPNAQSASEAENKISVGFLQSQYVTDTAFEDKQAQGYTTVMPSVKMQGRWMDGFVSTRADFNSVATFGTDREYHLWVPELYFEVGKENKGRNDDELSFMLGRATREWSRLDQEWGLGLWQPLFRWDYVRPRQMGLTGLFLEGKDGPLKFRVFLSGIHLPDQQGNFKVEDGRLVSSNRWFRPPISRLQIQHAESELLYEVDKPSVSSVVLNPSIGAAIRSDDDDGAWFNLAAINKPANQFHIGIETDGINNLVNGTITPKIKPTVVRHTLFTAEGGFQGDKSGAYASVTAERFKKPGLPEMWEQTPINDSVYYGVGVNRQASVLNTRTLIYSGFVYRDELPEENVGIMSKQLSSSTQKMSFERLWSLGVRYPVYPQRHLKWSTDVKYTYSMSDRAEWLSAEIGYAPQPDWKLFVGADVMGAPDENDGVQSFISKYRDNDRVEAGLLHVF